MSNYSIRVVLSPDERTLIIDKAKQLGLSVSAFLRMAGLTHTGGK